MTEHYLDEIVRAQKNGVPKGIASLCSAHPYVLKAIMRHAQKTGTPVLIESTCNQVNQYGGYTNMTPADFVSFVHGIAQENDVPFDQVLLGGDHLGPNVWQHEPAEIAMRKSCQMMREYINAGYSKIHLDASMKLADDLQDCPLDLEIAAGRAADLALVAEQSWKSSSENHTAPRYVIGTEVPIPGGAQEHEDGVSVTTPEDVRQTIDATRQAFYQRGLQQAWERVVALVVQPGVEFGDDFVLEYKPEAARDLVHFIEAESALIYEAHSTDYQTRQGLYDLVRDHFAILKVGPWLTFAFREAVFTLARIEDELRTRIGPAESSHLLEVMDDVMLKLPGYWAKYYRGNEYDLRFARKYSLSDRARYYWPDPRIQTALIKLIKNLETAPIPLSLLSQYAPLQYKRIRNGTLENSPEGIILDQITSVLETYAEACKGEADS